MPRRPAPVDDVPSSAGYAGAGELLAQAVSYALGNVAAVTPDLLPRPTPCRGWDIDMLLQHACDSLAALAEGFASGRVRAGGDDCRVAATGPAALFADRAGSLLGDWAACRRAAVTVGGWPLPVDVVAAAGALEIAVHGWDVAQASGTRLPIPSPLARGLLDLAPLLIAANDRPQLFGAPVAVGGSASASDELAAYVGRPGSGWPAASGPD